MAFRALECSILVAALLMTPPVARAQQPVATSQPGPVILEWTTESEVNLAGFNVHRSESETGPYVKINHDLIPTSADPLTGASYSYADQTAEPGVTYYYKLEDVELDGKATMHGPIMVVAQQPAASGGAWPLLAGALLAAGLLAITLFWLVQHRFSPPRRERPS